MAVIKGNQASFNSGEMAPWLDSRIDLDKYRSGARIIRNFICTPYGGVRRRMGTTLVEEALGKCRLITFQPTTQQGYILAFSDNKMRVYQDGQRVGSVELSTPWSGDEIFELQTEQINDVMFIAHRAYAPRQLSHFGPSFWTLGEMAFDYPPFKTFQYGNQLGVTPISSSTEQLSSSLNLSVAVASGEEAESPSIPVTSAWSLDISSLSAGTMRLEYTENGGGSWTAIGSYTAAGSDSGTVAAPGLMRLVAEANALLTATLTTDVVREDLAPGDTVNLQCSLDSFESLHVGGEVEVTHPLEENEVRLSFRSSGISESIPVQGDWLVSTTGNWRGTIKVQESQDSGSTWKTILTRKAWADRNVSYQGETREKVLLRMKFEKAADGNANDPHGTLEAINPEVRGRVLITSVSDARNAQGTVISSILSSNLTDTWRHGSWSDYEGYPAAVCWHESRLWFGGTVREPASLWASATEDYYNFESSSNDDGSFSRIMSASRQSAIKWLASKQNLFIGTSGSEWQGFSNSEGGVITPSSFILRKFSSFGSESLPAILTGSGLLFVENEARKIREISYSLQEDGYGSNDLTMLAVHVTLGKITDCAYQSQRDSIYWATTGTGKLIGCTYDKAQNIYAWHSHDTGAGDDFISVAVSYESGEEESVYVCVQRGSQYYIERFQVEQVRQIEQGTLEEMLFMDSTVLYSGPATLIISGLDHLEGRSVQAVADGSYAGEFTVSSGAITLDQAASEVKVGLSYQSLLETLPLDFNMADGSTKGRLKKVHAVNVRMMRSVTFSAAPVARGKFAWNQLDQAQRRWVDLDKIPLSHEIGVLEDAQVILSSGHDTDARCAIRITEPYPLNILSLQPHFLITDD